MKAPYNTVSWNLFRASEEMRVSLIIPRHRSCDSHDLPRLSQLKKLLYALNQTRSRRSRFRGRLPLQTHNLSHQATLRPLLSIGSRSPAASKPLSNAWVVMPLAIARSKILPRAS